MKVRVTVIGCSPAWPNPGGAHSGYLVESHGSRLLLDCGPGVLSRLRERNLLPIDAIAITHFHLDHCGDLVPWVWLASSGHLKLGRSKLFVPPGGRAILAQIAEFWGHSSMFEAVFAVDEYEAGQSVFAAAFELLPIQLAHYETVAFGLRVTDTDGRTLAYSGDTGPCPALHTLARDADLFLCEATLASADSDAHPRGHLAAEEVLALRARRTVLTHRPAELGTPRGVERAADGEALDL